MVRHRSVFVPVQADMPMQIILEIFESAPRFDVQLIDDPLKDSRQ